MRRFAHLVLLLVVVCTPVAGAIGLPSVVDLGVTAAPRFDGPSLGSGFGGAALAAGDLDGDGAPDVVIGAPGAEGGRGAAYVFFGALEALPHSRDLAAAEADLTIVGAGTTVGLGVAASVVDLDADGSGELVVTTEGFLPVLGRLASGGALVFRGGAELRARRRIDLGVERADASVFDTEAAAGAALATGDFDGDGYADLAVGVPSASGLSGAPRSGRTIVLFGSATFPQDRAVDGTDPAVAVVGGSVEGEGLGSDLAAGDLTGDRRDDLLCGTPNRTVVRAVPSEKAGGLFVVSGEALAPGALVDLSASDAAVEVLGGEYGDYLGRGAGVGDVTGDRVPDLVVSAIDGDGPANGRYPDCGEVFVLEGPIAGRLDLLAAPQWEWVIGEAPRRFTGDALVVADVDGDRRAELVAASEPAPGPSGASAGALYVVRGAPGTLDLASAPAATTVFGPSSGARLGSALLAADLDGDGVADVVSGAPGALGGRGSVFVVAGARTTPDAAPELAAVADVVVQAGATATVDLSATDADGDTIRYRVTGRPPGSTFTEDGDGHARLVYGPPAGATGSFVVTVHATDGQLSSAVSFALDVVAGPVPRVTKAVYRLGALKLTGVNFASGATIVLNGAAVTRPVSFKPARGRLVVRGSASELGVLPTTGANRVVVMVDGVASAPFAF